MEPDAGASPEAHAASEVDLTAVRHQLRTLVSAVISYLNLLVDDAERLGYTGFLPELGRLRDMARALLVFVQDRVHPRAFATGLTWATLHQEATPPLGALLLDLAGLGERARLEAPRLATDLAKISLAARDLKRRFRRLADSEGELPVRATSPPREECVEGTSGGSILVVDDSLLNREILLRQLRGWGHGVTTAAGGEEALERLQTTTFDAVLLDVMMPGLDGNEVLRRIKADPATASTPVIMISALDEAVSVLQFIRMGAEDFMAKPWDPAVMQEKLREIVARRRSAA